MSLALGFYLVQSTGNPNITMVTHYYDGLGKMVVVVADWYHDNLSANHSGPLKRWYINALSHQNLTLAPPAVISKEEGDQRMSRRARAIIGPRRLPDVFNIKSYPNSLALKR